MSDEQQIDTAGAVAAYLNPQQGQPALAAKASMSVATGSNPELEAELRRVAARTGVPIDSVRAYPDDVKRQAALQQHDFDQLAHQFPSTTSFLADVDNARIAHDDVENLSSTEATIGPIRGPKPTFWTYASGLMKSLPQGAGMAREGIRMQLADLFGQDATLADAQRKYSQLSLEQKVATPEFQSSTAQGVYGGLSSTIRAVPGLIASLATRSTVPLLATAGVQTEAEAYGKYRNRGASAGQALAGAAGEGAVEVATELLPMGYLVQNMGKAGAGTFLTGLLAREIPGEQIATVVQDAIDTAVANPDKTWGDYLKERPDAAYQTLLATITQAGMMEGANVAMQRVQGRAQEAQHAGQVGEALSQFNALAEASKVRERDAGTAQAFFQTLMQEGRDMVWITPQALAESGMLEQVTQALPDVAAQLEQAATTGADIRIPISDLIAHLAGPELEQSIIPHLSEEPGGFTKTSAEEYMASGAAQELADEVARTLADKPHSDAFNTSRDAVTAGFQSQLDTVGRFAPAVNQAYATMVGNFYAVQAARMGITPEEMATRYPLQVKAEAMPGVKTLEQAGTTESLVKDLQATYPDVKLDVMDSRGRINVSRIVLPKEQRGQGTGTKIMQQLAEHADATGKILTLTPAADFGGSVPRLKKFYKALGFVENKGKNKDYEISESMYRLPTRSLNQSGRTIEVDGVRRPIENSEGIQLADSFNGQMEFWKWYGEGAVDDKGRPVAKDGTYTSASGETRPALTYDQATRGQLSFGEDITAQPSVITLLQNADLSTFLHESGHFFLEVLNDMASRPDAPADIVDDMNATLAWFGVPDLATWNGMDLEAKRPHHEAFARGFEAYLFEGRTPNTELAGLFSRFRSWLVNVYKSLTALQVDLSAEVRGVFDRMLASSEAIAQAERDMALAGMFGTRPEFMDEQEWTAYRLLSVKATEEATRELETRSIKDMKWLGNAKSKVLRELQKDANFKRQQIYNEVRREVMVEPVYQAWQFLTLRGSDSTRAWPTPEFKLDPKHVDTRVDNLYTAIAKMGGLNRDEVKTKWGVDHRDMPNSGVFGAPILRKSGGLTIERMAEKLVEEHYLDQHDLAEFEDKFDRQRGGQEQFSWEYQWSNGERAPVEPLGDSNYHGKLHTPMLRHMFGEDSPAVQQLIKARMTATDGGLDPDVVAEMLGGFQSGREMVDALVSVPPPSTMINQLVDQRMLERHGDLTSEEAIDRAVNEALHQKAHIRFVQTELAALEKAAGKPAMLAKAAQAYAEQIVRRTPIAQLRPDKFTSAAKRAGRAADKAFKAGDIKTAAAEKQAQLINAFAAKAALDARNLVEKTLVRFKTITNGNNEKVAKTRDLDMVMATRAILAEYGVGTRGKKATEYLAAVEAYDPAMAAVLRERIDAATENARPIKELTIEQLGALKDEVESLWFLAKRSRQMEVDGDLLDRQDIQDQLVERLEEIGVPAEAPGAKHAITPGEVALSKLQSLRASLRRVEAWAGAKDGSNEMGPFRRFVWNTIKDHADAYRADKAKYLKAYRALLDKVAPTLTQVKIAAPELGYTFGFDRGGMGKVELLHAILHTGNAGNKKKLLLGRKWATLQEDGSIDTARWDAFIRRMVTEGTLTRADFDFAQGVWDLMEEMKPAAQKAHRDVFGRYFDEVTADPFTVTLRDASGAPVKVEYRGGYVPAIADSRIVSDAKTRAIMEDEAATLMNALPSTSKGFTKGRVEYNRPLLLDLRLLTGHIDKVLLFSHLEQPVRDVRRILGHSSVAKPLHLVDPAAYDGLLIPWLNRTARQQVETQVDGSNGLMRFFSVVRQRAGMAAMFANVSNTVQQITGFSLAALKVKPAHLLHAAGDFIRDPKGVAQAVAEASPYMANRMDNEVAAMTGAINDILLNPGVYERAVGWTQKHTYFMQSAMDNVMGPIIWQGAYNQALETAPADLDADALALYARRLADSAVRETQGSTLPEDISRIETGNAFVRLFTQFAGYFNMQANLLGTEFSKVAQETGLRKGMGRGFYILLFGFLTPAWAAQAIALAFRGGPDDEDKDGMYIDDWLAATFGWGTLRAGTALVPVVGQTINALANKFNGKPYDDKISTGPAISMIESAAAVPSDLYKLAIGEGSGSKTVRDVSTLISLMLGLPASAVARPVTYLTDVGSGKAKPTGAADAVRGAVTGASSPANKER
jgi:GNAT superfamily N-acetyltransferase